MHRTFAAVVALTSLCACRGTTAPPAPSQGTQPSAAAPVALDTSAATPAATAPATPAATATPTPAATTPDDGSFGFDRVYESCNSFSAHITNPTKTAWLDVFVAVKRLGLGPGKHALPVDGQAVTLTITELPGAYDGEWSCTDIGGGPPSEVSARWRASHGTLRIELHKPAPNAPEQPYDGPYDRVDIELDDVHFATDDGRGRVVSQRFEGLRVGWMPG
jgi:hypothetical protein